MKKTFVILLAVLLLQTVVGCNSNNDGETLSRNLAEFYTDFGCATLRDEDRFLDDAEFLEISKPYGITSEADWKATLDKITDEQLAEVRIKAANGFSIECKEVFENITATPEYYAEVLIQRF